MTEKTIKEMIHNYPNNYVLGQKLREIKNDEVIEKYQKLYPNNYLLGQSVRKEYK